MPGIFGLITNKPREWAEPQLLRMLKVLRHESFYMTGTWIDETCWGLRRVDGAREFFLGRNACPKRAGRRRPRVFWRGVSGTEHCSDLKERGHEFKAEGPSYLVHLYEEDPPFPKGLNGRFQGLLSDRTRGVATLFNDRYGMHRLYYHESKEAFYFAVEAKAILAVCPELRRTDPRSLGEFVACGCVLENRTLFEGIHVLPPASAWTFRAGSVETKKAYFEPREWEQQDLLDPESYHREIREIFSRTVSPLPQRPGTDRSVSDRRARHSDGDGLAEVPTQIAALLYLWGSDRECRDVVVARQIARECQQSHQVISVGDEFFARFPHYAERSVYLTDALR